MSDIADKLFETIRAARDGVQDVVQDFVQDASGEVKRLGTQGAMELASALFNGHGFVPYGPGQYTPTAEPGHEQPHEQLPEPQQDQGLGR